MAVTPSALGAAPLRRGRGFTLAEAVISGGIVVVLFAGAMAALTAAVRTVEAPTSVQATRTADQVMDMMRDDIEEATTVKLAGTSDIRLTVPDRDADGRPNEIIYQYQATGEKLVRIDGGATTTALLSGVTSFSFLDFTRHGPGVAKLVEDSTVVSLAASPIHPILFELGPTLITGYALVATPALPTGTTSWKVTGLRLRGRRGAATTSTVTIALRSVANGFPSSTVLASVDVRATTFPVTTDWVTIDWPDVVMPAGATAAGITITSGSALAPVALEAMVIDKATPWDTLFQGTLVLWTTMLSNDITYELLGQVTVPECADDEFTCGVRCTMTLSSVPGVEFSRYARVGGNTDSSVAVGP